MRPRVRRGRFLLGLTVVIVCGVGLWLLWPEISWRLGLEEKKTPPRASGQAREQLYEDDRRKLDELIKERRSK